MAVAVDLLQESDRVRELRELSWIFDIPIDLGRPDELLGRITGWAAQASAAGPLERRRPRQVMYANAHVLNQSRHTPALRARSESPTSSTATATACGWPPRRSTRRSRTA
jgi:hypothetical protein